MRNILGNIGLGWLVCTLYMSPVLGDDNKDVFCPATNIKVISSDKSEREVVCNAANKVLAYASSLGLGSRLDLSVILNERIVQTKLGSSYGVFRPTRGCIKLISIDDCKTCLPKNPIFGLEMNHHLYESAIVHEFAHAIADANKSGAKIPRVYHEYFAYVFQLHLMDEHTRAQVLARNDVPAFGSAEEITETYFFLSPDFFGVKSYQHYAMLANGIASLKKVLNGMAP